MNRVRRASAVFAALIGAIALGLVACSADVASPPRGPGVSDVRAIERQPASGLLGLDPGAALSGIVSNLMLYECATPAFGSVTQSVGPAGGVVSVGPHSLRIPAGALDHSVAITASTKAGNLVEVDFEPAGLRFRYSATLSLSYAHCDRAPLRPGVAYIDGLNILELLPALNDLDGREVTAEIRHFSGYAIAD